MEQALVIAGMAIPRIGKLSRLHLYLDEHMEAKGVSDADMAEKLETNRETVWRWRNGKRRPSNEDLAKVAFVLECEPRDLYSPPHRPSIDARLKDVSDELYKHVYDLAVAASKMK